MLEIEKKYKTQKLQESLIRLKNIQDLGLKKLKYTQLRLGISKYSELIEKKCPKPSINNLKTSLEKDLFLKKKLTYKIRALKKRKIKKISLHKNLVPALGILYLKRGKRNIFLTLCDSQNRIRASLSAGYLKFKGIKVKSKARKAMYNLKKLAHMLVGLILKAKFKKLHLKYKTSFPKRVKKTFIRILKYKRKKFKICKLSRYRCKPHNGCRRPKIRRK